MNVSDIAIAELMPHSGNMVLLDKLIAIDAEGAEASMVVKNEGLFSLAPDLPAWVGIELISQVGAAWAGYHAKLKNEPVKVGFLLGTRQYQSNVRCFSAGEQLIISMRRIFQDANGLASLEGTIKDNAGTLLVNATLSVYQPNDTQLAQMMDKV